MGLSFSRQYHAPGDNVQCVIKKGKLQKKIKSKKASPGREHHVESSIRRNERRFAKEQTKYLHNLGSQQSR
ncbi:hypothetical protein SISSUDRAFT_1067273 [Sistotremastrum suecicum HHB10207 ss-3]|uniref:Uncharacterized protein n=1 Tax=Sistotremastrum suecicum HHB10207 ss-3 TaxID=1314776 RepID=A0A165XAP7_9AGAM|nr:hypothetical protein SISSUDRAFT_1067273 [Sistotremastrum suecicum HHB10207 ss-3]